ncbi:Mob1/phocein [Elaphomyces granulatus]
MAAGGVSPSSSPRLPSPPPFTEVQIGPKSPTVGESLGSAGEKLLALSSASEKSAVRRIRPGTRADDMASGPPLVPLPQLDSPFQLQEHLKALYHNYTKPVNSRTIIPITQEIARSLAEPPEGVERSLWLYDLCRFLTMKVNNLIVAFFAEEPPCSAQTCPEMRASEWQYLCAVHDPPKSCCAIDYCCHTLDWASNILTSPKYFPSRLTLGSEAGGGPQASIRHLTNIFRRLYRIFAHAWFQHRAVFWQVEGHDGLYVFFKTVCNVYRLIPEDNYTIPPEAEGPEAHSEAPDEPAVSILRKDSGRTSHSSAEEAEPPSISTGATTRRHKHSASVASSVSTIVEGVEESDARPKGLEDSENKASPELPEVEDTLLDDAETPTDTSRRSSEPGSSEPAEQETTGKDLSAEAPLSPSQTGEESQGTKEGAEEDKKVEEEEEKQNTDSVESIISLSESSDENETDAGGSEPIDLPEEVTQTAVNDPPVTDPEHEDTPDS